MTPTHTHTRPWVPRGPRPYRQEVMLDTPPLIQIDIFATVATITRRRNGQWTCYPIALDALQQALADVPTSSGLLPLNTLAHGTFHGEPFIVTFIEPRPVTITIEAASGASSLHAFITPPLLWAACGQAYRLFAWPTLDPPSQNGPLAHAPFPNVYPDGRICWGTVTMPPRTTWTAMPAMLDCFFTSLFNRHLDTHKSQQYSGSIRERYADLDETTPYPLDDLVPASVSLTDLVTGTIWSRGGGG